MRKSLLIAFALCFYSSAWLQAQATSPLSGTYQKLILGVDPTQETVTGYYSEIDDPPNLPSSECTFYLSGKLQGDKYAIQAWQPGERKLLVTPGQLTLFSAENGQPSALLRLEHLSRDCTALRPSLGKGEGALLDKSKAGAWIEVRVVKNSKSAYYQTPDLSSPQRNSARRGSVLTVTARQPGWAQIQVDKKPKAWIQESDLYPLNPEETFSEPTKQAKPVATTSASPVSSKPTAIVPAPAPPKAAEAAPVAAPKLESKGVLLQRLKTLNIQAFAMALRVLANPSERNALASERSALEQELNAIVEGLNKIDPSIYRSESARISETYLDLQYIKQDQRVVSQRMQREIQKN